MFQTHLVGPVIEGGAYYYYYYIDFVSLSDKYLVVPLDGAVVFRKYFHFTQPIML